MGVFPMKGLASTLCIAVCLIAVAFLLGTAALAGQIEGPIVGREVVPLLSKPIRSLAPATIQLRPTTIRPRQNPSHRESSNGVDGATNPLIDAGTSLRTPTPPPILTFEGTGNPVACGGCSPGDPNGDVSFHHYVQIVNATKVAIFSKTGALLAGPVDLSTLWPSGICSIADDGDPIVLFDPLAGRWLLSQFRPASNGVCIAISQTVDPAGAYYLYDFKTADFPDYFKFGVWPDGYYMSTNESAYSAYAFDRRKMLSGKPANFVRFSGVKNFLMPADIDGNSAPAAGTPGYFYTFLDDKFHGGKDRIEIYELHADFAAPANSTLIRKAAIPLVPFKYTVCGFFNFDCVKQKSSSSRLDVVSEWPMFRFPYRRFSGFEAMAGTFTVGHGIGEVGAAVRWFELHKSGAKWTLFQQGTIDPGDGNDRFIGSIAIDAEDNVAVGYSVSSSKMFPAIRYSVHRASDAPGTMRKEATLIAGGGSQLASSRWGDYSAMSIDPSDGRTFWFTSQYYRKSSGSNWNTRIGTFRAH